MKRSIQLIVSMVVIGGCLSCMSVQAQSTGSQPTERDRTIPKPVIFAAPPPPPDVGAPGQRSDAGSRPRSCKQATKPLTAIVPAYPSQNAVLVWGVTASVSPSLWFYVPYAASSATGELILEDAGKQQTSSNVPLPAKPGVIQVTLADPAMALATGKTYRWYFNIYCRDRDGVDGFVEGSLTRKPLDAALQRQLTSVNLQQTLTLFASNGFWHEALSAAATMRCNRAGDRSWAMLLQAVGLDDFASEPLVNCLTVIK